MGSTSFDLSGCEWQIHIWNSISPGILVTSGYFCNLWCHWLMHPDIGVTTIYPQAFFNLIPKTRNLCIFMLGFAALGISQVSCLCWQSFLLTAVGTRLEFKFDVFSHCRFKKFFSSPSVASVIFSCGTKPVIKGHYIIGNNAHQTALLFSTGAQSFLPERRLRPSPFIRPKPFLCPFHSLSGAFPRIVKMQAAVPSFLPFSFHRLAWP